LAKEFKRSTSSTNATKKSNEKLYALPGLSVPG